jgi:DNA-binding response OmpR family regulator
MAVTHSGDDALRLLLIQPDAALADIYRLKLELDGYTVQVAADAAQALGEVDTQKPDLIFLDVGATNVAGRDLLVQLRSDLRTKDIPVVVLSGQPEEQMRAQGWELGSHECLLRMPSVRDASPGAGATTAEDGLPGIPVAAGYRRST